MAKAVKPLSENVLDTKSLNNKLMQFVGLTFYNFLANNGNTHKPGLYKNETFLRNTSISLTYSLDDQHVFLWPKLRELGFMIRYQYSELRDNDTGTLLSDWTYYATIFDISYKRGLRNYRFEGINKDSPALACAIAVSKLIDALEKEKNDATKTT